MIKKLTVEIDGTEIDLTPDQCQQLRDELLRLYPVNSAPVQPFIPLHRRMIGWNIPEITCGQTACSFRDKSVWQ